MNLLDNLHVIKDRAFFLCIDKMNVHSRRKDQDNKDAHWDTDIPRTPSNNQGGELLNES